MNNLIKNGQKTWTGNSSKKIYKWQVSVWKDVQYHVIRELQIKIAMRYYHIPIRMSKSKILTTLSTNNDLEHLIHCWWEWITCHFEIQFSSCAPWHLPKRTENLLGFCVDHTEVHSSFVHNCQNLEGTYILQ